MINVGCLYHDFDIRSYTMAYFTIFFEYPRDWDSDRPGFRLSISTELLIINYIRTFLHGCVEIKMDRIKFPLRCIGGFFSMMFMR